MLKGAANVKKLIIFVDIELLMTEDVKKFISIHQDNKLLVFVVRDFKNPNYIELEKVFTEENTKHISCTQYVVVIDRKEELLQGLSLYKNGVFLKFSKNIILNFRELIIFLGLFCKSRGVHMLTPRSPAPHKTGGYVISVEMKLPSYTRAHDVAKKIQDIILPANAITDTDNQHTQHYLENFQNGFINLLIAIDEIGMNYYSIAQYDSTRYTGYHFNSWLTTFSGIFDLLAIIAKYRYNIEHDNKLGVKLNFNKSSRDFLNKLYSKNPQIEDFLKTNSHIIDLVTPYRNLTTHELFPSSNTISYRDNKQPSIIVSITKKDFFENIKKIKEKVNRTKGTNYTIEDWGYFGTQNRKVYLIEPFSFVMKSTDALIDFIKQFFELLDFDQYATDNNLDVNHLKNNEISAVFNVYKLGY